jgi:hypothetical protein
MKARSACVSGNARSAVSYPEEPFSVTDEMYGADPDSTSISGQRGATLRPPSVKLCKDRDQQTVARIAWDIVPGQAHWSALTRSRRAGLIESGSRRQFDASGGCFTKEFDFQGAYSGHKYGRLPGGPFDEYSIAIVPYSPHSAYWHLANRGRGRFFSVTEDKQHPESMISNLKDRISRWTLNPASCRAHAREMYRGTTPALLRCT